MGVGTPHPTKSNTMTYSFFFFFLFISFSSTIADVSPTDRSLLPPTDVKVEAVSDTSMTLSWQAPNASLVPNLLSYVIRYSTQNKNETTVNVSADFRTKMVTGLRPFTNYTVVVSALYSGNRTASLPKFVVSTIPRNEPEAACDCHKTGTFSCDTVSGSKKCSCNNGYEGKRCDVCKRDFYLSGDECQPCDCSRRTSTGECDINVQLAERRTCRCLPGHMGTNCTRCVHLHFWYEDQCLPCSCLHTCPTTSQQQDTASCKHCNLKLNETKAGLESCGGRNESSGRWAPRGEGTVALIAVLVSLGFIALVAGSVTCYRYKSQRSNHHTFWSMELHEEKMSLNSACDYQRLDAATGSSSAAAPSGTAPCEGASVSSALRGREETRNGYHSMSM